MNCGNTRCLVRVSIATQRGVKRRRVFPQFSLDLDGLNKILFIVLRFFGFPFTWLFHLIFSNFHVFEGSNTKSVVCQRVFQVDHRPCFQSEHVHFWNTLSRTARTHEPHRTPFERKVPGEQIVLVKICLFERSSCTDKITPLNLMLLILELRWGVKRNRVGLAFASSKVSRFLSCYSNASSGREGRVFLSVRLDEQRARQRLKDSSLVFGHV